MEVLRVPSIELWSSVLVEHNILASKRENLYGLLVYNISCLWRKFHSNAHQFELDEPISVFQHIAVCFEHREGSYANTSPMLRMTTIRYSSSIDSFFSSFRTKLTGKTGNSYSCNCQYLDGKISAHCALVSKG